MKRQQYTKRSSGIKTEDQSCDLRRVVRRPDRAIYQPGVSSLGRARTDDDVESRPASERLHSTGSDPCPASPVDHGCDGDATHQGVRQKRPDAQLYVPKHRQPASDNDSCGETAAKTVTQPEMVASASPNIMIDTNRGGDNCSAAATIMPGRTDGCIDSAGSSPERAPPKSGSQSMPNTTDGRDAVRRQKRNKRKSARDRQKQDGEAPAAVVAAAAAVAPLPPPAAAVVEGESWADIVDRDERERMLQQENAAKAKIAQEEGMTCERFEGLVITNSARNSGNSPEGKDCGRAVHPGDRRRAVGNGDSFHNRGHRGTDNCDNASLQDTNSHNVGMGKAKHCKADSRAFRKANHTGMDTGRRPASCGRGQNRHQERRHGPAVSEGKTKSTEHEVKLSSAPIACGRGKRRQTAEERRHSENDDAMRHGAGTFSCKMGGPRVRTPTPPGNVNSPLVSPHGFGLSRLGQPQPASGREGHHASAYQTKPMPISHIKQQPMTNSPPLREATMSHMAGIIRLPPPPPSAMPHHMDQRYPPPMHMPPHPRGGGGGRGGQRSLYDPNNPSKPIPVSGDPQHMFDPSELHASPESRSYFMDGMMPEGMVQRQFYTGFVPPPPPPSAPYGTSPQGDMACYPLYAAHSANGSPFGNVVYQYPYNVSGEADVDACPGELATGAAGALVTEVMGLERELNDLLSRRIHGKAGFDKVLTLRRGIYQKCGELILSEPELSSKQNIEQVLWRAAFYQVIEMFRRQLASSHEDGEDGVDPAVRDQLLQLLDEGCDFYEGLLTSLQATHYFNIDNILKSEAPPPPRRRAKLALLSCQRCLICLGDLARYRQLTCHTANYGKARSWYMKAQGIAPKNGRPYNQLAILALYTKRRLDAVYYYMRSLAASNPFITARESLMSLFDEARKKAELIQKQKQVEIAAKLKQRPSRPQPPGGHRTETWILPDGRSCRDDIDDDNDTDGSDDLSKLSHADLNKRFVLSFLNVHGILFTRIGMESLAMHCCEMLREYQALLQVSPCPIGNMRLIQLYAINMFAIDNTAAKGGTPMEDNCRPLVQDQTIRLSLDMFTLLADRCVALLRQQATVAGGDNGNVLGDDLQQLLPGIKIWADWMLCHDHLWNPTPQSSHPSQGMHLDVWQTVAELSNLLKTVDISDVKFYSQRKLGCDLLVLEEDQTLAGFVPLLSLPQVPVFVESTVLKDKACVCLRVQLLRLFADYLCGIEPPVLNYSVESRAYKPVAPDTVPADAGEQTHHTKGREHSSDESESSVHSEDEEVEETCADGGSDIERLRARKRHLEHRVAQESRRKQAPALEQGRHLELVVRPRILVPDTNCFIDHLDAVQKLLDAALYVIVVPLVVINELDGLARGGAFRQDTEHGRAVKAAATDAVSFLETQFEARNSHLRALTCKGSVLETIAFRSEELQKDGTNDDKILSCCLHYCQDKAREYMPKDKDEPIRLHREVVLLTDDRNLRLKAHTRNVPVKDVPAFLRTFKIL